MSNNKNVNCCFKVCKHHGLILYLWCSDYISQLTCKWELLKKIPFCIKRGSTIVSLTTKSSIAVIFTKRFLVWLNSKMHRNFDPIIERHTKANHVCDAPLNSQTTSNSRIIISHLLCTLVCSFKLALKLFRWLMKICNNFRCKFLIHPRLCTNTVPSRWYG